MKTHNQTYAAAANTTENRFYIGDYELYTKTNNGVTETERETLHIKDDKQTVAIVDSDLQSSLFTFRYQLTNHLDSASIELDENADIISYEEYHPFGTTSYRSGRSAAEVSLKRYKYVFKELDNETGLYYYGMRYYAPWAARFVSVDPLQFDYPYYTPFQYAGNKPISYIDLDGAEEDMIPLNKIGSDYFQSFSSRADKKIKIEEDRKAQEEKHTEERTMVVRINSPWLINHYSKENNNTDWLMIAMSLEESNAEFKDNYAKRMFSLEDKSVADVIKKPEKYYSTVVKGIVWNNPNDHTEGFSEIELGRYGDKVFSGDEEFWNIKPSYSQQDSMDKLIEIGQTIAIDQAQGKIWEFILNSASQKALRIASPFTSIYDFNESTIKTAAKSRLRTIGVGSTVMLNIKKAGTDEMGIWHLKFQGVDDNGNEIWKETTVWMKEFENIKTNWEI